MIFLFILGIICCTYCAYIGFTGQATPFTAGLGWLTLVIANIVNLFAYIMRNRG